MKYLDENDDVIGFEKRDKIKSQRGGSIIPAGSDNLYHNIYIQNKAIYISLKHKVS